MREHQHPQLTIYHYIMHNAIGPKKEDRGSGIQGDNQVPGITFCIVTPFILFILLTINLVINLVDLKVAFLIFGS